MSAIAFHTQHDASLAISEDGELKLVLALERLFEERYFESSWDLKEFRKQWRQAIQVARELTGIQRFDLGVTSWVMPGQREVLRELVEAERWTRIDHHRAHATLGYLDSGFDRALVLSCDGGGNDGTFNVFVGRRSELKHHERLPLNLGTPYRLLGTLMPAITGDRPQPRCGSLSLAGKLMAYAALGEVRAAWRQPIRDYYRFYQEPIQALYSLGEALDLPLEEGARLGDEAPDLAATSQAVFEELLESELRRLYRKYDDVDGLVLTGGCALNVIANARLARVSQIPVHVPSAPGDDGIAVGALWSAAPPGQARCVFSGPELFDRSTLDALARAREARRVTPAEIGARLASGAVLGVARGRAEVGPRALGHRSILAFPEDRQLKERLNARVKFREAYRPFAPVLPLDEAGRYFRELLRSPYMSFGLRLRPEAIEALPAIAHLDGTARPQTVAPGFDPWLEEALAAVGEKTGHPVLLNTSLNTRGAPLINRVDRALAMLDELDLDGMVVEDWLFEKGGR